MKKSLIILLCLCTLTFRCSDPLEENTELHTQTQRNPIPKKQIDELIIHSLKQTNDFNWRTVSDEVLWSALIHGDSVLTVGYKPTSEGDITARMASVDVADPSWVSSRNEIIDEVELAHIKATGKSSGDLLVYSHEVLPFVDLKVTDIEVVTKLRSIPGIRYAEPLGYEVDFTIEQGAGERTTSDAGCSNGADNNIPISDYSVMSPNAKVPWNYVYMNIPQAWNYSTGQQITVGLIDTGISSDQSKLNGEFNSGLSSGRSIQKYGTYVSSIWPWASPDGPEDECGHGTAMAGTIAAPRSNSGSSVGVAYNCNLVSFRGTGDVVINGGKEKTGVADALVALGNRTDVRIISMSIGDVFTNSKVGDAIRYAYGKGKLIFCAAGTSTSFTNWFGVIFPASMNETVAVTGIKDGSGYSRCDVCHSGDKVDFTIIMERTTTSRHPLTLAMSGSQPATVGGSSVATATAAGIAALIWAKNPAWSRSQVLEKMKQSSSIYPSRHAEFGWGTPDALKAVQ